MNSIHGINSITLLIGKFRISSIIEFKLIKKKKNVIEKYFIVNNKKIKKLTLVSTAIQLIKLELLDFSIELN